MLMIVFYFIFTVLKWNWSSVEGEIIMSKIIHYCWFGGSEKPPIVKNV